MNACWFVARLSPPQTTRRGFSEGRRTAADGLVFSSDAGYAIRPTPKFQAPGHNASRLEKKVPEIALLKRRSRTAWMAATKRAATPRNGITESSRIQPTTPAIPPENI